MNYECRINLSRFHDKIRKAAEEGKNINLTLHESELRGDNIVFLTKRQKDKLMNSKKLSINPQMPKKQEGGFLGSLLSMLPRLAMKVLPALGIGALSGLASGGIEKIMGNGLYIKKRGHGMQVSQQGDGIFIRPHNIPGSDGIYLNNQQVGKGLILGPNSPFKSIPILGWIL